MRPISKRGGGARELCFYLRGTLDTSLSGQCSQRCYMHCVAILIQGPSQGLALALDAKPSEAAMVRCSIKVLVPEGHKGRRCRVKSPRKQGRLQADFCGFQLLLRAFPLLKMIELLKQPNPEGQGSCDRQC